MNTHLLHTIILSSVSGIGPASYWQLARRFPDLSEVYHQPIDVLRGLLSDVSTFDLQKFADKGWLDKKLQRAQRCIEWCEAQGISVLTGEDPKYPQLLRQINRCPPVLYIKGDASILSLPQIAVVGSRKPTPSGKSAAESFSAALVQNGFVITSGLALGIDAAAHRGALQGKGKTIAVLGTGIDQVYPKRNAALAEEILQNGGALVSEFPLGTTPTPQNFPQRNRIVSGLSLGTLVVEAVLKSGSLISAQFALEQNREVFAIPGAIQNPMSRGCHALIKQGATLVESAQDIVDELQGFRSLDVSCGQPSNINKNLGDTEDMFQVASPVVVPAPELNPKERQVLEAVDFNPCDIDVLSQRVALSAGELMACLMSLEIKSLVKQSGHGYVREQYE